MSSPEPQHEPQFVLDAVWTDHIVYLTIECTRCLWMNEVETSVSLTEVNVRAAEHAERCKC